MEKPNAATGTETTQSKSGLAAVDTPEIQKIGAILRGEGADSARGGELGTGAPANRDAGAGPGATDDANHGAAHPGAGDGDDNADQGDGTDAGDDAGQVDDSPVTLAELAKSLGTKEGELYDSLQVEVETTNADGVKGREQVTLGELRRGYIGAEKLEHEREQFDAMRDTKSLEFMQTRAELEALGALIAPHAPREVVDRMEATLNIRANRERALLLEAIPDWKDPAKFTAERSKITEFLKPWGFTPADVYGIADHRIARFVRDMARDAGRKAEAERKARERGNGAVKRGQAPDGRRSIPPLRARLANIVNAGKAATTAEGKTQAIGALLRTTIKR